MRVALIEDHLMMRDVLRKACVQQFGHEVVAECDCGRAGSAAVCDNQAELVLLDLQLPDQDGLETISELRRSAPNTKILALSSRCDPFTVYQLERAEIMGFVDKNSQTVDMLGHALDAISQGKSYFSPIYSKVRQNRLRDPNSFDKVLSDREQTVLACLGDCWGDEDVAQQLGISRQTAEKHRFNVMRKLNLATTPSLMRYAQANGFHFARVRHRL